MSRAKAKIEAVRDLEPDGLTASVPAPRPVPLPRRINFYDGALRQAIQYRFRTNQHAQRRLEPESFGGLAPFGLEAFGSAAFRVVGARAAATAARRGADCSP
jgi:hypothetical protein